MAPEMAAGRNADVDARTDIYLLGATLYHILTGKPPRVISSKEAALDLARTAPSVPPRQLRRDVPRPLEAICLKAMAFRQADRYSAVEALYDRFHPY